MELAPINTQQATSTSTADPKTITTPVGTTAVLISALTTSARITFDGTAPASTNGVILPAGALPLLIPLRRSVAIKFASTAGTSSVLDVASFA
jgi:hypothetical protein